MPAHPGLGKVTNPMRDDPVVTDLVTRARNGDERAWDALVERYAPLIWSVCRRHRLGDTDADDVGQNVWLQMWDHLDAIRDPAALVGWLVTTTRRECIRVLRCATWLKPWTSHLGRCSPISDADRRTRAVARPGS
jgi:RNA polymerase sigma factor (sigma-70 family)